MKKLLDWPVRQREFHAILANEVIAPPQTLAFCEEVHR
jgi:hypothetical protein